MNILLAASARTGSSLLLDALSHMSGVQSLKVPPIPVDNAILLARNARWVDFKAFEILRERHGKHYRICIDDVDNWLAVHLFRANKLRQAISAVKAEQSNRWSQSHGDVTDDFNYVYSRQEIKSRMCLFSVEDARRFRFLEEKPIRQLQVCYEAFTASHVAIESTARRVLDKAMFPICQARLSRLTRVRQYDALSDVWERCFLECREPTPEEVVNASSFR